jgi:hypothetical protein
VWWEADEAATRGCRTSLRRRHVGQDVDEGRVVCGHDDARSEAQRRVLCSICFVGDWVGLAEPGSKLKRGGGGVVSLQSGRRTCPRRSIMI